ncbi:MAG: quinolinate synthase NadA [Bacteroidales bacterium]|jgi:quinolinate synthase|nr:quinolinate synthase NadA [Bacteroidales bacterium]
MKNKILKLKKEKNAILLAHYYTLPEVQEIADYVGDSLALAQAAATTDAQIILFAGVHFMAETAKILNPTRKVIIPDMEAGCSLADSCPADDFAQFLQNYPNHTVLSYINCSAAVKALSDIIVTSGNALNIVSQFPVDENIVFAPDRNLGAYVNAATGRNMVLWDGACHVHDQLNADAVFDLKQRYPQAKIIAHPECKATVLALADFVGSTAAMLKFVSSDSVQEYIVATETGIIYEMLNQNSQKVFHIVTTDQSCSCNDCEYMKKNTLTKIEKALRTETPEIKLDENLMVLAKQPLLRMLEMGR